MTQFDRVPSGSDPIETESYRILRSRIDLTHLPPMTRAVTERVIHASADFDYATNLVCDESALAAGVAAITRGAPVVADVAMVASGITGYPVICKIGESIAASLTGTHLLPNFLVEMIRTGEISGNLGFAVEQFASELEKEALTEASRQLARSA